LGALSQLPPFGFRGAVHFGKIDGPVLASQNLVREGAGAQRADADIGGGLVRWLGGFDLLVLRTLAAAAAPTGRLVCELELPPARAARVIRWCVDRGILSAAPEPIA
jgi:hypothetical protein